MATVDELKTKLDQLAQEKQAAADNISRIEQQYQATYDQNLKTGDAFKNPDGTYNTAALLAARTQWRNEKAAALATANEQFYAAANAYNSTKAELDSAQSALKAEADSAKGQTAEQQATENLPAKVDGSGQGNNDPNPAPQIAESPLTDSETAKLEQQSNREETAAAIDQGAATTGTGTGDSESNSQETNSTTPVISAGGSNSQTNSTSQSNQTVPASLLKNKLHDFTSYTYKITLFLLTREDYTAVVADPTTFQPKWTLISSGGALPNYAKLNETQWHPDFSEDFYFDNLRLETVVGLNARTKASNAIDISFSIIEPYGMTLLDRLLSACQTTAKSTNYVDQPYLLQIDFLANPEEVGKYGSNGIVIDQKRIPIRFLEFKIKPNAGGTVYNIKAIPYNHIAYLETAASVPVNLSVEAKTVKDFFDVDSTLTQIFDKNAAQQQERLETTLNKLYIPEATEQELQATRERLQAQFVYTTKSFPAAYNTYHRNVAYKEGRFESPLYQVRFEIDPLIGNSNIIDTNKENSSNTTMTGRLENYLQTTATGGNPNFKEKSVFNISYGTDIVNLIDRVISASDYVRNQVRDYQKEREQETQQTETDAGSDSRTNTSTTNKSAVTYKPTDWFKIIPSVVLGKYDNESHAYSKLLTYSIVPYKAPNFTHPDFKTTKVSATECVRTYNYLYTGLNQDVISLDIDFDATFYTGIVTFKKQLERTNNYAGADKTRTSEENKDVSDNRPAPTWLPGRLTPTPADSQMSGYANRKKAEDYSVASVARSLYSAYPRGDMLNVKVRIVGDPAFIKQDDIYYNPLQSGYPNTLTVASSENSPPVNINTGQIIFDNQQVYVQLLIKGVVDIDDKTGITNKKIQLSNGQVTNGSFSGVYRVMRVTSELTKGKFEQILDLIRVPESLVTNYQDPSVDSTNTTGSTRPTTGSDSIPSAVAPPILSNRPDGVDAVDPALKTVASGPATNPNETSPGSGVPAGADQPSSASKGNADNASRISTNTTNSSLQRQNEIALGDSLLEQKSAAIAEFNDFVNNTYNPQANALVAEAEAAGYKSADNLQKRIDLRNQYDAKIVETAQKLKPLYDQTFTMTEAEDKAKEVRRSIGAEWADFDSKRKFNTERISKTQKELDAAKQ